MFLKNSLQKVFFFVIIWIVFFSCDSNNDVVFPEDGISRYIVFRDQKPGHENRPSRAFVSTIFIYNFNLNNDSALERLSHFAKYFHCKRNQSPDQQFRIGRIEVLSSPKGFDIAPRYDDNAPWREIRKRIKYRISTKIDRQSGKIEIYKIKKHAIEYEGTILKYQYDCSEILSDSTTFSEIDELWWTGVQKLSEEAWRNYLLPHKN